MSKINLAKQNQYVEFAQKDSKSRNIDEELDKSVKQDVDGNVVITGALSVDTLTSDKDEINAQKPVVEVMNGYTYTLSETTNFTKTPVYASVVKNGNKLTFVNSLNIVKSSAQSGSAYLNIGMFKVPSDIHNKLYSTQISGGSFLDIRKAAIYGSSLTSPQEIIMYIDKTASDTVTFVAIIPPSLPVEETFYIRYEATFLLSDNLAA